MLYMAFGVNAAEAVLTGVSLQFSWQTMRLCCIIACLQLDIHIQENAFVTYRKRAPSVS